MEITRAAKPLREMADVKLWHCAACGVVHMGVKGMVLNFSREDFTAFAEAVVDINYGGGWPSSGSVIDLIDHDAESYVNAVVN